MRIRILFQFRSSAPAGIRRGAFRRAQAILQSCYTTASIGATLMAFFCLSYGYRCLQSRKTGLTVGNVAPWGCGQRGERLCENY
jgi:hypothetical protein